MNAIMPRNWCRRFHEIDTDSLTVGRGDRSLPLALPFPRHALQRRAPAGTLFFYRFGYTLTLSPSSLTQHSFQKTELLRPIFEVGQILKGI
jgi:hypothetical protein